MKLTKRHLNIAILVAAFLFIFMYEPEKFQPPGEEVIVLKVFDGDTIEVAFADGLKERVRLLGIDAPEMTPEKECLAQQSQHRLFVFLYGHTVTLHTSSGVDRDQYDRLLRYVEREELDAAILMLQDGLATRYYDQRHEREELYTQLEEAAKQKVIGVWGECE